MPGAQRTDLGNAGGRGEGTGVYEAGIERLVRALNDWFSEGPIAGQERKR
ncbi:hypothetical protein HRbin08_00156 [bacterium HR08]|nr:hypothetical protein HRbin08_00156 [bacterium HR08]